jgi:hypothetical protein
VSASEGAEQVALLVIFATSTAVLPGLDRQALDLAVWFIGAQAVLSYATAGIAKAISPEWTAGEALALIMGSESHGHPYGVPLSGKSSLSGSPVDSRGHWIRMRVSIDSCRAGRIYDGDAGAWLHFHAGCAITMGLNTFLLVLPGT